jgi:hypothetical protein
MKFIDNIRGKFINMIATIYMKSGNVIVLKNLKTFNVTKASAQVTGLEWEFENKSTKLMNLNVDQIEAIVLTKKFRWV